MTTETSSETFAADAGFGTGSPMWTLAGRRYRPFAFQPDVMREIARLRPDDWRPVLWIAMNWIVIVGAALATLWISWWLYPLAVLAIAAQQRGLTTIAHDAAHRTLAKTRGWNYAPRHPVRRLSAVPEALGPTASATSTCITRIWATRPATRTSSSSWAPGPTTSATRAPISGGSCGGRSWAARRSPTLKYLFVNRFRVRDDDDAPRDRTGLLVDVIGFWAFWTAVVAVGLATGTLMEIVLFWVVPYLTVFQILGWFIELAEHTPMCETETQNVYLTRNRKGNWMEWLLFGVNYDEYHLEHHLSPGVPF